MINATEKQIAKEFSIPLKRLQKMRNEKKFNRDICFTFPNSIRILYNIEKFREWFEKNKLEAHQDFNAQIKAVVAQLNAGKNCKQ
jgi:hypothetical protein|tara:strand:- start:3407 stop:3661 length:255 start_codon:yes stop_codon:yes gene_type:complete